MSVTKKQKDMKQKLIAIALMLSLSAGVSLAAPKHRHHQKTEAVQQKDTTAQDEVVAYSDTTSVDEEEEEATTTTTTTITHSNSPWDDDDNPFSWLGPLTGSVGGILIACLVLLILLLIALSPFIILALILRLIINRHNDRITLAEKAMETGQPIPEELKPIDKQTDDYLWSRGIRNVAIGAGLFIMFWIWKSTMLSGLGALVLCYGIGQMVIARTSANKNRNRNDDIDPLR